MPPFLIVALAAWIVSLPVFRALPLPHLVSGKAVRLSDVLFVLVVCALLLAGRVRRRPLQRDVVAGAVAVVLAMAAVAIAGKGPHAAPEVARTAYSMLVLVVLAHVRLSDGERRGLVDVWLLTTLGLAAAALATYVGVVAFGLTPNRLAKGGSDALGASIVRVSGGMHPTTFAIYLTLGVALAVHRGATGAGRLARHATSAIVLLLVACALTFSRAIAGVPIALAVLACRDHAGDWLRRWRHALVATAAVFVLAVAVTTLWPLTPLSPQAERVAGIGVNSTHNAYPLHHLGAVRMFAAHPVAGVGPGAFGAHFCAYTSAAERGRTTPPLRCDVEWDPHSLWLGAAAHGGLILLGGWLALYVVLLRRLTASAGRRSLVAVAVAALVALIVDGAHVDWSHVKFVWAFLGLALGSAGTDQREREAPVGDTAATR